MAKKNKFYAVRVGRTTGIFTTWDSCQESIKGYRNALYKSFNTREEAQQYLDEFSPDNKSEELQNNEFYVYTDGSFINGGNYSYGFVVVDKDKNIVYKENGVGTKEEAKSINNIAGEILGVVRAIEYAKKNNIKIFIFYDYAGLEAWANNSWKTNNPLTEWYKNYMQKNKSFYRMKHVKGHSGDKFNSIADSLAKEALGLI
ncbi:ribonuclease H1 domain-containing protein (plasmid) [Clostridium perfringens]